MSLSHQFVVDLLDTQKIVSLFQRHRRDEQNWAQKCPLPVLAADAFGKFVKWFRNI
jgi:hypothetical protein